MSQTPLGKWYSHASVVYMCVSNQMAKPPWWNDTVMQVSSVCIKPDGQTPLVKWYGHTSVFYMCVSNQMIKHPYWNYTIIQVFSICVYQTKWPNPLCEMIRSCKCFLYVCIKPDVLILPLSQDWVVKTTHGFILTTHGFILTIHGFILTTHGFILTTHGFILTTPGFNHPGQYSLSGQYWSILLF